MKKIILTFASVIMLSSCQEQQKIAFVDNTKVVNDFKNKVDFEAKFKTKIETFNNKADSLNRALQMEAQVFQSAAAKMNKNTAEETYNALVQKKQMQDYQLKTEEQSLQSEGQRQIDTLVKQVKSFIKDFGKKNGYTFILGANEAGSVLYGTEGNDITIEVLEALNNSAKKAE